MKKKLLMLSGWNLLSLAAFSGVAALLLSLHGCQTFSKLTEGVTGIAVATGTISSNQAESINRSAKAVEKTWQDITPEQEYYLGRAVTATALKQYAAYDRPDLNRYLNLMGQTLARFSDKPDTFGGYHFLAVDSEDINAYAAPGGLIVVTRGMLRLCRTEDALAAVLAHEIGHVQCLHGLKAIKKGRLTSALTTLALEAGKNLAGENLAAVAEAFEGSIEDITQKMMKIGYGQVAEGEADRAAVQILQRSGYDPNALIDMLAEMKKGLKPGGLDFMKTHPDPNDRIGEVRKLLSKTTASIPAAPPARQARFAEQAKAF